MEPSLTITQIVERAISTSLELPDLDVAKRGMSPNAFIQDFQTFVFGLPRRSGKSTWIAANAKEKDLVIVHSQFMKKEYNYVCPVYTVYELQPEAVYEADTLYIDEPWLIQKSIGDIIKVIFKDLEYGKVIALGTAR